MAKAVLTLVTVTLTEFVKIFYHGFIVIVVLKKSCRSQYDDYIIWKQNPEEYLLASRADS